MSSNKQKNSLSAGLGWEIFTGNWHINILKIIYNAEGQDLKLIIVSVKIIVVIETAT